MDFSKNQILNLGYAKPDGLGGLEMRSDLVEEEGKEPSSLGAGYAGQTSETSSLNIDDATKGLGKNISLKMLNK